MRSATAGSLALLLLSQLVQAEEKVSFNTITKVQVKGASVEIVGSQKPNFTTFTMADPPRLVVDISEAVFSGVQEQMDVANGPIIGIKTASYGSDASAIARVLIGFQNEADTDIQVKGTSLIIRVTSAAAPAAPAVAEEKPGAKPGATAEVDSKSVPATQAGQEAARAEQERQAGQQRLAQQEKKAEEARLAKEEAARKQEEAKQALAQEKQRQKDAAEAKRRSAEDEKQAKLAAAEEKKRQAAEAREAKKREAEAAKLDKQQAAAEAKLAKQKATEEAKLARQQAAEEAKLAKQQAAEEKLAKRQAAAGGEGVRAAAEPSERISVSSHRKKVSELGFKQQVGASRVFVRTNEPVRYTVNEGQGKTVILELENTSIGPRNNSRFLDTSYFDTAVAMVTPSQGRARSVRIEIRLKEAVPFEAHQEGNEVFLDFPRPAKR